jgi:hypothetical protein
MALVGQSSDFVQVKVAPPTAHGHWVEITLVNGTVLRVPAHNLAALELALRTTLQAKFTLPEGG